MSLSARALAVSRVARWVPMADSMSFRTGLGRIYAISRRLAVSCPSHSSAGGDQQRHTR